MSVVPRILLLTLALCLGWGLGIASLTTRTNADGIRVRYAYDAAGNPLTLASTTANGCSDWLDNDGVTNTVSTHSS